MEFSYRTSPLRALFPIRLIAPGRLRLLAFPKQMKPKKESTLPAPLRWASGNLQRSALAPGGSAGLQRPVRLRAAKRWRWKYRAVTRTELIFAAIGCTDSHCFNSCQRLLHQR